MVAVGDNLVAEWAYTSLNFIGPEIPTQELLTESATSNRGPNPHKITWVIIGVAASEVVASGIHEVFVCYAHSSKLAGFFRAL